MKVKIVLLLLSVCLLFSACEEPRSVFGWRTLPEYTGQDFLWLNLEGPVDAQEEARKQRKGTITISPMLSAAMKEYPDHVVFAVGVCFSAMVKENVKLSRAEYMNYMAKCGDLIYRSNQEIIIWGGDPAASEEYHYFYLKGTREQIELLERISCPKDITMHLTAIVCLK